MSAFKDGTVSIFLGGKERKMIYSLNVIDKIQDRAGDTGNFDFNNTKNIRWLATEMLNDAAKLPDGSGEILEEETVGIFIHIGNLRETKKKMLEAMRVGNTGTTEPTQEEKDEDGEEDVKKNQSQ
ncbi:MAG: hypothetical protein UIM27_02160 [Acutalibacteraceae bacterium]|nr:hypothetical protein [Acutalibacteraceae bacterium]